MTSPPSPPGRASPASWPAPIGRAVVLWRARVPIMCGSVLAACLVVAVATLLGTPYSATAKVRLTNSIEGLSLQDAAQVSNDLAAQNAVLASSSSVLSVAGRNLGPLGVGHAFRAYQFDNSNVIAVTATDSDASVAGTRARVIAEALAADLTARRNREYAASDALITRVLKPLDSEIATLRALVYSDQVRASTADYQHAAADQVTVTSRANLLTDMTVQRQSAEAAIGKAVSGIHLTAQVVDAPREGSRQGPSVPVVAVAGLLVALLAGSALALVAHDHPPYRHAPERDGNSSGGGGRPALILAAGASVLALAGASTFLSRMLFTQPSTVKYLVTVLAPMVLLGLLTVRRRARALAVVVALVTPFSFTATFAGLAVTPLSAVLATGLPTVLLLDSRRPGGPRSATAAGASIFLVLLVGPLLIGHEIVRFSTLLVDVTCVGWLFARVGRDPGDRQVVLPAIVASITVQAAIALYEFRTGARLNLYGASGQGSFTNSYFFGFDGANRPTAALPDPISLGNLLALGCPLALAGALSSGSAPPSGSARPSGRGTVRIAMAVCGCVIALGTVVTLSRMSWIGAAVGIAVVFATSPLRKALLGIAAVVAVASLLLGFTLAFGGPALRARFASIGSPTSVSNSTAEGDRVRMQLWAAAERLGETHPVFGVGLGDLSPLLSTYVPGANKGSHAQDLYLQVFAEAGVVGVTGLGLLLLAVGRDLVIALRRDRMQAAGLIGAVAVLLVVWTTDITAEIEGVAGLIAAVFGLAAGIRMQDHAVRPSPRPSQPHPPLSSAPFSRSPVRLSNP